MNENVLGEELVAPNPSRVLGWLKAAWLPAVMVAGLALSLVVPQAAFAAQWHGHLLAAGGGNTPQTGAPPSVSYGNAGAQGGALASKVTTAMQGVAEMIRLILGGTALVVILVAAVMNHFVHDQQAKMRAKELIGAAVVGLLLAAFAPAIVNFIAGL